MLLKTSNHTTVMLKFILSFGLERELLHVSTLAAQLQSDRNLVLQAGTHYSFSLVLLQYVIQLIYIICQLSTVVSYFSSVKSSVPFHAIVFETSVSCARHLRNI